MSNIQQLVEFARLQKGLDPINVFFQNAPREDDGEYAVVCTVPGPVDRRLQFGVRDSLILDGVIYLRNLESRNNADVINDLLLYLGGAGEQQETRSIPDDEVDAYIALLDEKNQAKATRLDREIERLLERKAEIESIENSGRTKEARRRELDGLIESGQYLSIQYSENWVIAKMPNVSITRNNRTYDFGDYTVYISLAGDPFFYFDGHIHPYLGGEGTFDVNGERTSGRGLCTGNAGRPMSIALGKGELGQCLSILHSLMNNYDNDHGPYRTPSQCFQ